MSGGVHHPDLNSCRQSTAWSDAALMRAACAEVTVETTGKNREYGKHSDEGGANMRSAIGAARPTCPYVTGCAAESVSPSPPPPHRSSGSCSGGAVEPVQMRREPALSSRCKMGVCQGGRGYCSINRPSRTF